MNNKPQSCTEIYEQYHGLGDFAGKPIVGGFAKLEEAGAKWRECYSNAQQQLFSKFRRIAQAIDAKIASGVSKETALVEFDSLWTLDEVNMNPTKMITKLQKVGFVKANARKRKAPGGAREQRRDQHRAASGSAPLRPGAGGNLLDRLPRPPINLNAPSYVV
jgi:hypothetical protein